MLRFLNVVAVVGLIGSALYAYRIKYDTIWYVESVVKLLGMVNAEPDFADHPKVINGCSDLFVEVLGDAGRHARSAIGVGSLPNRMMVEIEAIFLVRR